MDNTTVDVNKFHVELASNPFDAQVHVSSLMSDMQVAGVFKGRVDFTTLADVIPLDSMTIKGLLQCNIDFGGKMSYIEKEQYDKFKADGMMNLTNFEFVSPDLPQGFKIIETTMNFSPKYVDLATLDSRIGKSDLKMNGRLENFIPFVFSNGTVRGNLNINSNILDANEFLAGGETPTDTAQVDTTPMTVIEIPKNVDFTMKANINHIYYDKMDISNLNGNLKVKDAKVNMDNLSMNMLEGSMVMNGEYNTQNVKKPTVAFDMNIKGFDIPTTIKSFDVLKKIASSAKEVKGKVSTQFKMTATLDSTMSPVLNSIYAKGKLQSESIGFTNSKVFGKIGDVLKSDALKNPTMKDVNLSFTVKDGRIYIDPFDTKLATFKANIGGDMGLDQTLNFKVKTSIPRASLGSAANDLINSLTSKVNYKLSDNINVNLKIGGTTTSPEVKPDWGGGGDESSSATKTTVKETVKENVLKYLEQALKDSAKIKSEAIDLAEKTRKEAYSKADALEAEGKKKGGLAYTAAKASAKQIRKEGDAASKKIIADADKKTKELIEKARAEAEKK